MKSNQLKMPRNVIFFLIVLLITGSSLCAQGNLKITIGKDTILPLKQSSVTSLELKPLIQGLGLTALWTQLTGPLVNLELPNLLNTRISGFSVGDYSFKCLVLDGLNLAVDTINVRVVDYQQKNRVPCRSGPPKIWTLSATSTTDLIKPYLRRDGMDIQGGDTIKINRNPNNGGIYGRFYLGDFGGDEGCPVIVVPNGQIVEIGGPSHRWHIGKNNNVSSDSNFVNHAVIDGTYLRNKGIEYGFQSTGTSWGISTSMVTDLEIKGCLFQNNSLGVQMKIYSDSNYAWTVYDNFIMKNIKIHDNFFQNITSNEGMYVGHTSPSGTTQAGNDGPTPRMDSVYIYNNFLDSTRWDAMQVSSARYAEMHDNIIMHSATLNASSQNWGILMGGDCTGKIYNNVVYNGTSGTVGSLGYGPTEIYYNFLDSTTGSGMYINGITSGILEAGVAGMLPPLRLNVHDNIISRFEDKAIHHTNNDGRAIPGIIRDNYIVDPAKSISQVIATNAGDAVTNNNMVRSFPVTVRNIGNPWIGVLIEVRQGAAIDTFTTAKDAIDWLYRRISGTPPPNMPPTANAGKDETITLPVSGTTLSGTGADTDGSLTGYSWTKISGPNQFSITNSANAVTTLTNLVEGVYQFKLQVTDNQAATDADTVKITVSAAKPPVNVAPIANAGNNVTITLPINTASLNGSGSDADGSIIAYNWTKITGPVQFTFSTSDAAKTTVTNLIQGIYYFRLEVTDNLFSTHADTVIVVVNPINPPANKAPTAAAGNDITITAPNSTVTLSGSGTDADGYISTYSWTKIQGPASFEIASPAAGQTVVTKLVPGVYQFQLSVKDNVDGYGSDIVNVTVNTAPVTVPANAVPVVNAGASLTISLPVNSVTLRGIATDPDGIISLYSWRKISGPASFSIVSPGSAQTVINSLVQGVYIFELTATDNSGASAKSNVMVTVNRKINLKPEVDAGEDKVVNSPINTIDLQGFAIDPDGVIVSYRWKELKAPMPISILNPSVAETSANGFDDAGIYTFELMVVDNDGAISRDTLQVEVKVIDESKATLFPNPATDVVNLKIVANTHANMTNVTVYDVTGKPVIQDKLMRSQTTVTYPLDISNLPPGIYMVEVSLNLNEKTTCKLVKL